MLTDVSLNAYDPLHRISIRDFPISDEHYATFPRSVGSSGLRLCLVLELHINSCSANLILIKTVLYKPY
jgi:hypothetical protein